MSRLTAAFGRARADGRAAFIGYLTAGDPTAGDTVELARALEHAGADVYAAAPADRLTYERAAHHLLKHSIDPSTDPHAGTRGRRRIT